MMTAVSVVIMTLGSLIPVNTYVCPVLCILLTRPVLERCGQRIGWCCYLASSILSLLLAPDREAALVYAFLGFYPMIRSRFNGIGNPALRTGAKLLLFTAAGAASYGVLLVIVGAGAAMTGGWLLTAATLVMWDVLFVLVDRLLGLPVRRRR